MDNIFELLAKMDWRINLILIPVLLITSCIILFYVLKPQDNNYIYKLYSDINEMIKLLEGTYHNKTLKLLNKQIMHALYCCDSLIGSDMYELENIVASLTKASDILRAVQLAKIPLNMHKDYMPRVMEQLEHSKSLITAYYMEEAVSELKRPGLNRKKNQQNAQSYLDELK